MALPKLPESGGGGDGGGDGGQSAPVVPVGGSASVSLEDVLGPVVVAEDGHMRRIANWDEMSEQEKAVARRRLAKRNAERLKRLRGGAVGGATAVVSGTFAFRGFTCAFRRKPAAPGFEGHPPLLLVHPVGIGLSSWFWERFMEEWTFGPEVFAPDFVGCGESDEWKPNEPDQGLFIPLDWVRQLESLWREHIRRPSLVVCQGGLAPVAVRLATRNADDWLGGRAICGVVLASPPTFDDISNGYDAAEVERNYALLASPLGGLGYRALRTRPFVRFFSDLFLFSSAARADDAWLDRACDGATMSAWPPVLAFNAGLVGQRGLAREMRAMSQPLLVLSGNDDKRAAMRQGYLESVARCELLTLAGCNVLPWEAPAATADAIARFAREVQVAAAPDLDDAEALQS